MLNKWLLIGGIVLASLVACSSKAQAQLCGSGYIQEGGQGYINCIQIQQPPQYNPSSGSGSSSGTNNPSQPGFRPSQVPINELTLDLSRNFRFPFPLIAPKNCN
jgi:hypothetical protein